MEMVSTLWTENLCHVGCIVQAGCTHEAGGLWVSERSLGPGCSFFFFSFWDMVRDVGSGPSSGKKTTTRDDNSERQIATTTRTIVGKTISTTTRTTIANDNSDDNEDDIMESQYRRQRGRQ
jgi:hypothetical protein